MRHLSLRFVGVVLIFMLGVWLTCTAPAPAETGETVTPRVSLPEPLTREAIRELVARMSDAEVRQLLLAQLDKSAPTQAASSSTPRMAMIGMSPMVGGMDAETHRVRAAFREMVMSATKTPEAVAQAIGLLTEGRARDRVPRLFALLIGMVLVGWGAERLFHLSVRRVRHRLDGDLPAGYSARAGQLVLGLFLDLLSLVAFGIAALALFFVAYQGHEPTRQLALTILAAALLVRFVSLAARFLLAPAAPTQRLLPFDDGAARRLWAATVGMAVVFVVGRLGLGLLQVWGLPRDVLALLGTVLGLGILGLFLGAVWRNRAEVAVLIRGREPATPLRRLVAELWPILMTAYVVLVFLARVFEQLSGEPLHSAAGISGLFLVIVLPLVDMGLCRVVAVVHAAPGEKSQAVAPAESGYEPVLRRGVHITVTIGGLLLIGRLWGLDLFDVTARRMGTRPSEALLSILVTLLAANLAWELARTAIDQRLARLGGDAATDAPSRLRTILPLVRGFFFVTLCTMTVMIVLASLGVNIGPLLAGAGVVGIAVGFGAQTLVRDIVSGLFFLMDDSFRHGEYVDVGDVKGTVEKIGLRSMQLRHHRGALNTVPYGMIRRLVNESRDWTIVKLEFRLAYGTDIGKIRRIFKQIGEELQDDPELAQGILEPLKSQGVIATEESGLVVQAKFKAKPGDLQYVIRREAYARILKAFTVNGIRFAQRQVAVSAPPETGPDPVPSLAAAAAAEGFTLDQSVDCRLRNEA